MAKIGANWPQGRSESCATVERNAMPVVNYTVLRSRPIHVSGRQFLFQPQVMFKGDTVDG